MTAKAQAAAPDLSSYATTAAVTSSQAALTASVNATVTSLSNQVAALTVSRPAKADALRTHRQWSTHFQNSTQDALTFDLTGFSYVTDAYDGAQAIQPTTNNSDCSVFLKTAFGSVGDVDVRIRYRYASGGAGITVVRAYGRYLNDSNYMGIDQQPAYQAVTQQLQANTKLRNANTETLYGPNYSDTARDEMRVLRFQIVGGVMRAKQWLQQATLGGGATDQEPEWQVVGDPNPAVEILDNGRAGMYCIATAAAAKLFIHEITITELSRDNTNLLWNADAEQVVTVNNTNAGVPVYWQANASGASNVTEIVSATDPWGDTRNVFHISKPSAGSNCNFKQVIYNRLAPQALDYGWHRPLSSAPKVVEWEIWSKGTNVAPTGSGRGAAVVMYYYNRVGDVLNLFDPYYVFNLGPDTTYGKGTWGWTRTVWRMPLNRYSEIENLQPVFGLHDDAATGDLLVCCPRMRAVPS